MSIQGQPVNAAIWKDLFFVYPTFGGNSSPNQSWLKFELIQGYSESDY
jgi:hypothetical protein